ncbi:MAG: ATP-binding protein [Hyphomicrobiales bacterium]
MLQNLQEQVQRQLPPAANPTRRWVGPIGLTIAVGIAYFLAAQLSLVLLTKPNDVAVFWPAAGVAAGILIALGPRARLPVAAGTIVASFPANFFAYQTIWGPIVLALSNAGEVVLVAGLIERYFGSAFSLGRLRCVLGLLAAAIVGSAVGAIGGTVGFGLFQSPTESVLTTWYHWFTSNTLAIVSFAPVLIGLVSATRDPPPRSEVIEGVAALVALTFLSGLIIFLPRETWTTVLLIALVFPLLLWLAARCRPLFAAAAAFIVALTLVWTTTFGMGIFGDANFPIAERILVAQAGILAASLCASVLAALFSERSENEARLARSNMMLQRERDNKLMNLEAMAASISHEVRQPLATIATNSSAALRFLGHAPPDLEEVQSALNRIITASHHASEVFDNIRALFGSTNQGQEPVDVNEIALGVMNTLQREVKERNITTRAELTSELPLVMGHRGQLQEVILNLARNGIEAMDAIKGGSRVLRVKTENNGRDGITVTVEDTGPGIDPKKLDGIFDAFVTTKPHGMGLGLAICRMIIDRHGGQLSASSDGKRGALFQFVLPIKAAGS